MCLRILPLQTNGENVTKVPLDSIHVHGLLQQYTPQLSQGETWETRLPFLFTSTGKYKIVCQLEQVLLPEQEAAALLPPQIIKGKVKVGLYVPSWSEKTQTTSVCLEIKSQTL